MERDIERARRKRCLHKDDACRRSACAVLYHLFQSKINTTPNQTSHRANTTLYPLVECCLKGGSNRRIDTAVQVWNAHLDLRLTCPLHLCRRGEVGYLASHYSHDVQGILHSCLLRTWRYRLEGDGKSHVTSIGVATYVHPGHKTVVAGSCCHRIVLLSLTRLMFSRPSTDQQCVVLSI